MKKIEKFVIILYYTLKKWKSIGKNNIGEKNFMSILKNKLFEKERSINLIICCTPLQMIVAQQIIKDHPNEIFYSILISEIKNECHEYYFNQLKQKSKKAYSFYYPNLNKNYVWMMLLELKIKGFLLPKAKTIFLASIEKLESRILISCQSNFSIKTFDDGTANLVENSHYLEDDLDNYYKYLNNFLNPNYNIKKVRDLSLEHFTIFKNLTNIMDNGKRKITYIKLFNTEATESNIQNTVKILLGNPEPILKEISEKAIEYFNIEYFIPHPRQTFQLDNVKIIKSTLVVEDYMIQEIKKNPNTLYHIYTFFSGAIITMKDFKNVKVTAIKPKSLPEDYFLMPVYTLYKKSKITIENFDDTL